MTVADAFEILLEGLPITLLVSGAALLVGAVAACPLVLGRSSRRAPVRLASRWTVDILRAVPPIVWLFLLFFGLPQLGYELEPLTAGTIGLGIIAAGYICEIYRAGLESVPSSQWDAAQSLGLRRWTTLRFVGIPQALVLAVPALGSYTVGMLKDSAVVSTIGLADVTFFAYTESQRSLDGVVVFATAAVIYLCAGLPVAVASRWVSSALASKLGVR